MRKNLLAMGLILAFGCTAPDTAKVTDPKTKAPDTTPTNETPPKGTSPAVKGAPEAARHAAFRLYGLDQDKPSKLVINAVLPTGGETKLEGTQTTTFIGLENGQAKYLVERTGELSPIGNDTLAVDEQGVWIVGTSTGKLQEPSLEMPANVEVGSTWKTAHKITLEAGTTLSDDMSYKAVKKEKIKTKVGEFEALVVEAKGKATEGSKDYRIESRHWFVEGRGAVKIEITRSGGGQKPSTMTIEEVP